MAGNGYREQIVRRSKEEAAETRRTIVKTAASRFRKHGIAETGLADLMGAAGLTHGGFYRHFDSKDRLVAEAATAAFASASDDIEETASKARRGKVLRAVADRYLRSEHRSNVAHGCPLAALGGELARSDRATRAAATDGIRKMLNSIVGHLDGLSPREAQRKAIAALAAMVGALTMARIVTDPNLSASILDAVKEEIGE